MAQIEYKELWERLNLDLEAHEALLEVLGKFYGDIYLSQQGRLAGMEYLDFVISEIHLSFSAPEAPAFKPGEEGAVDASLKVM